ncbi:MAG: nucleotidyltransferase domain-containing protein [Anaerolineales bacterium]
MSGQLVLHSMNWRLDFAKQLAVKIRAFAGLRAIVAGGSVVRGYADAYSDLELLLFWDALPDDDTRHALIETLQADFLYEYNGPSQEDQLLIHNFQAQFSSRLMAPHAGKGRSGPPSCSAGLQH